MNYILVIDQSTSNTKTMLFDDAGMLKHRVDIPHRQITPRNGWVEHDAAEIYRNVIRAVRNG